MYFIRIIALIATAVLFSTANSFAEEIKVGIQLPLTGIYARTGNSVYEGINASLSVFQKRNPNFKVKFMVIDDEMTASKAVSAVEKMASEGAVAIAGGLGIRTTGPGAGVARKENIPYLTSMGPGDDILELGYENMFRLTNINGYARSIAGLVSDLGVKKVSILTVSRQDCVETGAKLSVLLQQKGIKLIEHRFDPNTSDFKPLVNKVKVMDQPEILILNCVETDVIAILRAVNVLKPNLKSIVSIYATASSKLANEFPDLVRNVFATSLTPFPSNYSTKEGKEYVKAFKNLYKKEPDYMNLLGFVQGQILFEAIKRAADKGSVTRSALMRELRATDNKATLLGRVTFNEKGDNPHFAPFVGQHHKNAKIPLVWPKEVATAKMNYPALAWQ